MKSRMFFYVMLIFGAAHSPCAFAQHENCNHGDAPDASIQQGGSNFVCVDGLSSESINLKTAAAEAKKIESLVTAVGKIENIPENVAVVSTRIAGRVCKLYVSPDASVKEGDPICKIESLLPGNPPPSVLVKAPKSGIVEALNIFRGSPVEPNAEIARIADTSKFYAVANVFESYVGKLKLGMPARVKLEAYPDKIFSAKLVKFGASISAPTNTLPVYFEVENPSRAIRNGMRGIFYISTNSGKAAVSVPKSALTGGNARKFVYVERCPEDKIYERRQVVVGRTDDLNAEILHGLKAGEKVAISGVYQLQFMPAADMDAHADNHAPAGKNVPALHSHDEHMATEHLAEGGVAEHPEHVHSELEHSSPSVVGAVGDGAASGAAVSIGNGDLSILEKLGRSGYFKYFLWALLGVSILLNVIFAAAFARSGRE